VKLNHGIPVHCRVFCIDFGLSKPYRDRTTARHVPYQEGKKLTGTPRYASINCHLGRETSRRDDLESMAYLLIYFLQGRLPWQGLKARTKAEKYSKITEKKLCTPISKLCRGLPKEIAEFLSKCKSLGFDQRPPYEDLRALLIQALEKNVGRMAAMELVRHPVFDWDVLDLGDSFAELSTTHVVRFEQHQQRHAHTQQQPNAHNSHHLHHHHQQQPEGPSSSSQRW